MQQDSHLVEHTETSEEVFRGSFLRAVRDTVRLPDGGKATREYILHPGAVMIVPLDKTEYSAWRYLSPNTTSSTKCSTNKRGLCRRIDKRQRHVNIGTFLLHNLSIDWRWNFGNIFSMYHNISIERKVSADHHGGSSLGKKWLF